MVVTAGNRRLVVSAALTFVSERGPPHPLGTTVSPTFSLSESPRSNPCRSASSTTRRRRSIRQAIRSAYTERSVTAKTTSERPSAP